LWLCCESVQPEVEIVRLVLCRNVTALFWSHDFEFLYMKLVLTLVLLFFLWYRNEEIVMPAEQVGLVRDNYLWKVNN